MQASWAARALWDVVAATLGYQEVAVVTATAAGLHPTRTARLVGPGGLDVGVVPVVADRQSLRLVGMLTDRDAAVRCLAAHHTGACRVRDHMTTGTLVTADPGDSLEVLVARMERAQVRRVPVLQPDGRLLGIVAQADVAMRLGPESPAAIEELLERISEPAGALA